jgi:lipopolysaccharide transport system ATP-binding protein
MDVFQERRSAGRTLVLVTHDMPTVESMCDRAMLLEDGGLAYVGDPHETALHYFRVNFAREHASPDPDPSGGVWDVNVKPVDAWLENAAGERVENVEQGEPIELRIVLEARRELASPIFAIHFVDARGNTIFGFNRELGGDVRVVPAGGLVRIGGTIDNPLVHGRYFVECFVARSREQGDLAFHRLRLLDFVVFGSPQTKGMVVVEADVAAELEP